VLTWKLGLGDILRTLKTQRYVVLRNINYNNRSELTTVHSIVDTHAKGAQHS